jgi:hypothetical protein
VVACPIGPFNANSPWKEEALQRGLHQLVEAQLLSQLGLPPLVTYRFKHPLIQEEAYQPGSSFENRPA